MADFVAPQFQYPDMMQSLLRGQTAAIQSKMAPGAYAEQQQGLQAGALNLAQLRQMMSMNQQAFQGYQQTMAGLNGQPNGTQPTQTGNAPGGSDGGTQNGPQGAVAAPQSPQDPLAALLDPRRITANAAYGSLRNFMSGKDPNQPLADAVKLQAEARDSAIKTAQIQANIPSPNNPMPMLKSFAGMDPQSAGQALLNNPQIMAQWPKMAQQYGVDPFDKTKIPYVAALEYNQRGGPLGLSVDVPQQLKNVNLGQGEVAQIDQKTGKKVGDLVDRQTPTFSMVDKWNPDTGKTEQVPVQSGGYGMQGVGPGGNTVAVGGATSKYPAAAASIGFDKGFKAPTDPELKAAMFGSEMRSGLQTLTKMESGGFNLTPAERTAFINAATSEDPGAIHQFFSQEYLSKMSPKAQTYMAALMPMLQAAGHDQSGARLTTSQVRQNIESLLPIDVKNPEAMAQINKNRQGFYMGLLGQAGSSTQLPQYKSTLGADLKQAQSGATAPAAALAHLKAHPELADQFKSKYGYLPQ